MIDFFLFHIEIEGKCGWIIGGGEDMFAPSQIIRGAGPRPPLFLRLRIYHNEFLLSILLVLRKHFIKHDNMRHMIKLLLHPSVD